MVPSWRLLRAFVVDLWHNTDTQVLTDYMETGIDILLGQ